MHLDRYDVGMVLAKGIQEATDEGATLSAQELEQMIVEYNALRDMNGSVPIIS